MLWPEAAEWAQRDRVATIDHIVAQIKGGLNVMPNLALAHARCNSVKSDSRPTGCEVLFGWVMYDVLTEVPKPREHVMPRDDEFPPLAWRRLYPADAMRILSKRRG